MFVLLYEDGEPGREKKYFKTFSTCCPKSANGEVRKFLSTRRSQWIRLLALVEVCKDYQYESNVGGSFTDALLELGAKEIK